MRKERQRTIKINIEKFLLIGAFIFYVFLGVLLTYNFDFSFNFNLLFNSDNARVIADASELLADHYRLSVHPLFIILVQPLYFIIKGIVQNKMLALIILSSATSAVSVLYIYKILNLVAQNKKNNLLLSLIYMFSFSNYIYTAGIEMYNFSTLFLIILWYFYIKKSKKEKYDKYSIIILILLGVLAFGFTISNYAIFLIVILLLFISKKIKLKYLVCVVLLSLTLIVGLNYAQNLIWHNTPKIWDTKIISEKKAFSDNKINTKNFKNVISNDYMNSLISNNIYMKTINGNEYKGNNQMIIHMNNNCFNIIIFCCFYLILLVLLLRNIRKEFIINFGLLLALSFNSILHLTYGNDGTFLYSLHFLYIIILLLGININLEESKKIKRFSLIALTIFLVLEFVINNVIFIKILKLTKNTLKSNYLVANLGFLKAVMIEFIIILLIAICTYAIIKIIKNSKNYIKKDQKAVCFIVIISLIIFIECIFIALETTPLHNKLLWKSLPGSSATPKTYGKEETLAKSFKQKFTKELKKYIEYKDEYNEFLEEHDHVELTDNNWDDFYFFGLANRRKILYKKNNLIDLETGKKIYSFTEEDHLIVPNIYSILIETTDGKYIKIYEDNSGVHFNINGKDKIITGTNQKIKLYSFENQKWQNIKKVLYGEILFNIKDSKIYPNILVYNKPWYRDAAMASMVLKQTNNTNLISKWVKNIEDIYDRQNDGIQETDNLGELLYILSTQDEINYQLVDKIEKEAEKIAENNENGYYLNGKTDFQEMNLYQNLWYKLGIESVGRKFPFKLSDIPKDGYTELTWWSNYKYEANNETAGDINYPYLSLAKKHKTGKSQIAVSGNLYPLSWEKNASQANYNKMKVVSSDFVNAKLSPVHTWTASEMLLLILDETGDLDIK